MTRQLLFVILIQALLMAVTTLLLLQPKPLFRFRSPQLLSAATMSGLVLLCITFCWSVIVGCVLALRDITFAF